MSWIDCDMQGEDFSDTVLTGGLLTLSRFDKSLFDRVMADEMEAREASFRDCSIEGATFYKSTLTGAIFDGAHGKANFKKTELQAASFSDARLDGSTFERAACTGADFRRGSLRHVTFVRAKLAGADFTDADLQDADLDFAALSWDTKLAGTRGLPSLVFEQLVVGGEAIDRSTGMEWLLAQSQRARMTPAELHRDVDALAKGAEGDLLRSLQNGISKSEFIDWLGAGTMEDSLSFVFEVDWGQLRIRCNYASRVVEVNLHGDKVSAVIRI